MKSLIVYYSYSGNTQKVAEALKGILEEKGEADMQRLLPTDESDNFFIQCNRAFQGRRATLPDINFDLSDHDLLCLGTPVWAFAPTPAINTFLDKIQNLDGRYAMVFTTSGSGAGVKRCADTIIRHLKEKGASKTSSFNIPQAKINNINFIEQEIKKVLPQII